MRCTQQGIDTSMITTCLLCGHVRVCVTTFMMGNGERPVQRLETNAWQPSSRLWWIEEEPGQSALCDAVVYDNVAHFGPPPPTNGESITRVVSHTQMLWKQCSRAGERARGSAGS